MKPDAGAFGRQYLRCSVMPADKYRIDSHKLIYHVGRVNDWLDGRNICPVYMEVSPAGACNHRCVYCALDFMEYQARFLETEILKARLSELGRLGLKSIMYAGEGEPLLHKDLPGIVRHTAESGISVAITTNAVLLKPERVEEILPHTEWIKVSINAGMAETYAKIHRTSASDFDKVIGNLAEAVRLREEQKAKCALGGQLLLLPENHGEVCDLAMRLRDIGLDYLVVKPYSQHPQSHTQEYEGIKYERYMHLAEELGSFNTEDFSVIFRVRAMQKWDDGGRDYVRCLALPFWSYIDAGGNVWGCSMFLGDERFAYGNIYENTFAEIWEGSQRHESLRWVENEMDVSQCRVNCRMDDINRYLWELKCPVEHVNFI